MTKLSEAFTDDEIHELEVTERASSHRDASDHAFEQVSTAKARTKSFSAILL